MEKRVFALVPRSLVCEEISSRYVGSPRQNEARGSDLGRGTGSNGQGERGVLARLEGKNKGSQIWPRASPPPPCLCFCGPNKALARPFPPSNSAPKPCMACLVELLLFGVETRAPTSSSKRGQKVERFCRLSRRAVYFLRRYRSLLVLSLAIRFAFGGVECFACCPEGRGEAKGASKRARGQPWTLRTSKQWLFFQFHLSSLSLSLSHAFFSLLSFPLSPFTRFFSKHAGCFRAPRISLSLGF